MAAKPCPHPSPILMCYSVVAGEMPSIFGLPLTSTQQGLEQLLSPFPGIIAIKMVHALVCQAGILSHAPRSTTFPSKIDTNNCLLPSLDLELLAVLFL